MPSGESETITSTKSQVLISEKAHIIISEKVFDKIKQLCAVFNKVEWSGIIWMDIQGTVEDPAKLKIKIVDFTLLDIGSSAYTEFVIDPDIIMDVYGTHPEYMSMKYGCLHSHNSMNVFFSGTDTSTLLEQAFIHNFFVSLIVNNAYDKIAKISYKGKKKVVKKIQETFFNRIGNIILPYNKTIDEITEEDIVYVIDCIVDYEKEVVMDSELDNQIKILLKKIEEKEKLKKKEQTYRRLSQFEDYPFGSEPKIITNYRTPSKQLGIFAEEKLNSSKISFNDKCENFVKRLLCVDYVGDDSEELTLEEARERQREDFKDTPKEVYLEEVKDVCSTFLRDCFEKEIERNWNEDSQFSKLRMMMSSHFSKFLNIQDNLEREILEIIDFELKMLDHERKEGII